MVLCLPQFVSVVWIREVVYCLGLPDNINSSVYNKYGTSTYVTVRYNVKEGRGNPTVLTNVNVVSKAGCAPYLKGVCLITNYVGHEDKFFIQ
jgi:hypothetical protein